MSNKVGDFSFDTEEKNIFGDKSKGRPRKSEQSKLTEQICFKVTKEEMVRLEKDLKSKPWITNLSGYIRYLILK